MIKNLAIGGGSNRTLLLLALLLGLIAAILIGVYLSSLEGDSEAPEPAVTTPVVVAAVDIPPLTEITEGMLTVQSVPVDLVLTGGFTDISDAVGETTQVALVPGEQVLQSKVTSPESAPVVFGDDAPLSLLIPEGKVAFSIAISAVGAAGGLVRPGDRVDVILSGELENAPDAESALKATTACYALQNVEILALNSGLKKTTSDADAAGIAAASTNPEASRATLAVSADEAWQLAALQGAVSGGGVDTQLWLALRPFGDSTVNGGLPACTVASSPNLIAGS
jgi:pilus assembly protein CpaB